MLRDLKRLLFGTTVPYIEHPVFGRLYWCPGRRGPFWMHDADTDDDLAISITATQTEPPSQAQVSFYQGVIANVDAAFQEMAPLLIDRYEKGLGRPFPAQWRTAFKFAGMGVPVDGKRTNDWDIAFTLLTDDLGYIFTCYYENGVPAKVSMDT
jgi:hypothetical protein